MLGNLQNKGLINVLVFYAISSVNDLWSLTFGFPTLNHLFVGYLIIVSGFKFPQTNNRYLAFLINTSIAYLVVVVINSVFTYGEYMSGFPSITVIFKFIAFLLIIPQLTIPAKNEPKVFFDYLIIISICTVVLPGYYELFTNTNLMETGYGISTEVFNLRAFTIDKVDFGFNIVVFIAASFLKSMRAGWEKKIFYYSFILLGMILLFYSFSSTNIVGLLLSMVLYLLIVKQKKMWLILVTSTIVPIILIYNEEYTTFYEKKYKIQEYNFGVKEFRSLAFYESIDLVKESPFFGHGSEANGFLLNKRIPILKKDINSHNLINELTNYGLVGFIPFLTIFYFIFAKAIRLKFQNEILFFYIILSGVMISRLLFYYHRFDKSCYFIWMLVGMLAFLSSMHQQHQQKIANLKHARNNNKNVGRDL